MHSFTLSGSGINNHVDILRLERLEKLNAKLISKNKTLKKNLKETSFLHEVLTDLIKTGDFYGTTEAILKMAVRITDSEVGFILMESKKADRLNIITSWGKCEDSVGEWLQQDIKLFQKCVNSKIVVMTQENRLFRTFEQLDPLLRSLIAVPLKVDKKCLGILVLMHRHHGQDEHRIEYNQNDIPTVLAFARQAGLILDNTRLKIEHGRRELFLKTITVLTSAIDAKDAYTRYHSRNVGIYAVALAKGLGLSEEEITSIHYGAILHDIGKIGVPEVILNKPDKLTVEEISIIKTHPKIGANMLDPIDPLEDALDIVRYHHERFDGKGYPSGLKGESIPYCARIACIADSWDAMTSHRSYRKALPVETAIKELQEGAGSQFDPYMVGVYIDIINENPELGVAKNNLC